LVNGKKGRRVKGERRRGVLHTPTMKQPVISTEGRNRVKTAEK